MRPIRDVTEPNNSRALSRYFSLRAASYPNTLTLKLTVLGTTADDPLVRTGRNKIDPYRPFRGYLPNACFAPVRVGVRLTLQRGYGCRIDSTGKGSPCLFGREDYAWAGE